MEEKDSLEVVSVRLVRDAPIMSDHKLECPDDAIALVGDVLKDLDREVVCIINLKSDGTPINCNFASMGTVNQGILCPRELFKSSILSNAAYMVIVHNHPSQSLIPSAADINMTGHMVNLCDLMGIPLKDHVIVGGDNSQYFSFLQKELMPNPHNKVYTDYNSLQFTAGQGNKNAALMDDQKNSQNNGKPACPDMECSNKKVKMTMTSERGGGHGAR